jgi:hypothetical protein
VVDESTTAGACWLCSDRWSGHVQEVRSVMFGDGVSSLRYHSNGECLLYAAVLDVLVNDATVAPVIDSRYSG